MTGCDEILWVQNILIVLYDVSSNHGVHVVNVEPTIDLPAGDAEVTTLVTSDYFLSKLSPLPRSVEVLVHPTVIAESWVANLTSKGQISVPLDKT
jgi:hypothetical protein